jgi:hypothetical protein
MAKWFFGSGSAVAVVATRRFGSVGTAIADSVIAVPPAVTKPVSNNDAVPTAATRGARKAGWTNVTDSGSIVAAARHERA